MVLLQFVFPFFDIGLVVGIIFFNEQTEDIKDAAIPVLQHRVIVTPEREMEGLTSVEIIKQIIESIEIPR